MCSNEIQAHHIIVAHLTVASQRGLSPARMTRISEQAGQTYDERVGATPHTQTDCPKEALTRLQMEKRLVPYLRTTRANPTGHF